MRALSLLTLVTMALSGCAMTSQHVKTMDGDEFNQRGGALFSKQKYVHGLEAEFYPNNSGAHIEVKGEGVQDGTDALKTINLLAGALATMQAQGPAPQELTALERIDVLMKQIESLRTIVDALKPTPRP